MFAMLESGYKNPPFQILWDDNAFRFEFNKKSRGALRTNFFSIHHRAHLNLFMFSTNYVNSEIKNVEWLTFFMHDSVKRETHLWHDMQKNEKKSFIR